MKAIVTFDDKGGVNIEGDEDAVRKAYEIWNPFNAERLNDPDTVRIPRKVLDGMKWSMDGNEYDEGVRGYNQAINDVLNYKEGDDE